MALDFNLLLIGALLITVGLSSCVEERVPLTKDDVLIEEIYNDGRTIPCESLGDNEMASTLINLNGITWDLAQKTEGIFTFVHTNPHGNDTLIIEPDLLLPDVSTLYFCDVFLKANNAEGEKMILINSSNVTLEGDTRNNQISFTICNYPRTLRIANQDLKFTFSTRATFVP